MHANGKRGRTNTSHVDEQEHRLRQADVEDESERSEDYLRKEGRIRK